MITYSSQYRGVDIGQILQDKIKFLIGHSKPESFAFNYTWTYVQGGT